MGRIYPEIIDNIFNIEDGEATFYKILSKSLDDDYIALYDTELKAIKCRYNNNKSYNPDFIIISKYGLLIVEIKDWHIGYIKEFSHDNSIIIIDKDGRDLNTYPYRQAKNYSRYLFNTLNNNKKFNVLKLKWDRVVVFPYINRKDFISRGFDESRSPSIDYLFSEDINSLQISNDKSNLDTLIKNCFEHKSTESEHLTKENIDDIYKFIINKIKFEHDFSDLLANLYHNQREIVKDWHNNSQILLRGVSGSGKTVLLKSRAHYFADQNKDEKILFLTHTNKLRDYIANDLKSDNNIFVYTKSSFLLRLSNLFNLDFNLKDLDNLNNINALQHHISSSINLPKYKGIFIDEVQDFKREELMLVKSLLKDPNLSHFVIALDAVQNIYGNNYSLKDIVKETNTLYINYRNTQNISKFSYDECNLSQCDQMTLYDFLPDDQASKMNTYEYYDCYRDIERVNIPGCDVIDKKIDYENVIEFIDKELKKLNIHDNYVILTAQNKVVKSLQDKILEYNNCIIDSSKVYTVHKVKGLEFKLVFLINKDFYVKGIDRDKLKYVGCTRAQELLYMIRVS